MKDKLRRFLLRASRVLTGATYHIRSEDLIDYLSRETLDDRRRCAKLLLTDKLLNYYTAPGFKNSFVKRIVDQINYPPKAKGQFLKVLSLAVPCFGTSCRISKTRRRVNPFNLFKKLKIREN